MLKKLAQKYIEDLKTLSAELGNDILVVQAAGGNTSLKQDGILWVKASGKYLANALKDNIFVPVNLQEVRRDIEINSDNYKKTSEVLSGLRPSIETTLHVIMPHNVVIHTHPVSVIAQTLISENTFFLTEALKGINWSYIRYCRPGEPLTKAVSRALSRNKCDVLILANHGLVVGGETCEKAKKLHQEIYQRLNLKPRELPETNFEQLEKLYHKVPHSRLPQSLVIHSLGNDSWSCELANRNPAYPDHVVFCGIKPLIFDISCAFEKAQEIADIFSSQKASYIIIRGLGVLLSKSASYSTELMLHAQAEVLARIPVNKKVNLLTNAQCHELMDWDAEKYRQSLGNHINL